MKKIVVLSIIFILLFTPIFPLAADCSEGCDTENVLTYNELKEIISSTKSDIESIQLQATLLKNQIKEDAADDSIISAVNIYIDLMNVYIEKRVLFIQLETIFAHAKETKNGLAMFVSASLTSVPTDEELSHKLNASDAAFQELYAIEIKLLNSKDASDVQAKIQEYNTVVEEYIEAQVSYLRDYYLVQMSSWEDERILTRYIFCADRLPCLDTSESHYFTNFARVKVWVGYYSSSSPNMSYFIGEDCYTYFTTNFDYYWSRRIEGTNSIQIKFFHNAYENTTRHNAIWVMNKEPSGYNPPPLYARYTTTSPSNGDYNISISRRLVCCEQTYNVWRWCNIHCGGCFACDPTGCQNFIRV